MMLSIFRSHRLLNKMLDSYNCLLGFYVESYNQNKCKKQKPGFASIKKKKKLTLNRHVKVNQACILSMRTLSDCCRGKLSYRQ